MPRLADRAVGTLGHLAPKAVGLLSTIGFAAAGVVSVVAENLRTLADRDEALPDRAKQVARNSIGAVLAGPKALSARGRSLVGKDGGRSGSKTTAKTVAPEERPDRSKAEEARDRDVMTPDERRVTAGEPARKTPQTTATAENTAKAAAKPTAEPESDSEQDEQDRPRSVEEKRAAEKAAKKQAKAEQAKQPAAEGTSGANGREQQEVPEGVPAGVDEQLVADLQTMTVKQLRDRAAADGVPGRSGMSKDELVVALATRETDDVPTKT